MVRVGARRRHRLSRTARRAERGPGGILRAGCDGPAGGRRSLARAVGGDDGGGLDALREVRPAFDTLYAVLDDGQRKTLDDMLTHRAGS